MSKTELEITFPGGLRVDAVYGSRTIPTDQSPPRGDGTAPSPFDLFLSSIGTCAGIYVLSFCLQRNISPEGIRLVQRMTYDNSTHLISQIELEIQVPESFPEKYHPALIRAADQCAVKRHLENPPKIETSTRLIS